MIPDFKPLHPTITDRMHYDTARVDVVCPICGQADWLPLDEIRRPIQDSHFVICKNDGFMTYTPQLANLQAFYASSVREQSVGFLRTKQHKLEYHKRLIIKYCKEKKFKPTKVLDYGCSDGYVMKLLQDNFKCEAKGIELNPGHANWGKYIEGLDITTNADLTQFKDKFDLIVCYHVLEHYQRPDTLLKAFHSMLDDKGRLYLALPTIDRAEYPTLAGDEKDPFGTNALLKPDHINVFTNKTLIYLLNQNGFQVDFHDHEIYGYCVICTKEKEFKIDKLLKVEGFKPEDYAVDMFKDASNTLESLVKVYQLKREMEDDHYDIITCRAKGKKITEIYKGFPEAVIKWCSIFDEIDQAHILREYIEKFPNLAIYQQHLGLVLFKSEDYEEAIKYLKQSIETIGYNQIALEYLMYSYNNLRDVKNTIYWAKEILKFYPYNPHYFQLVASIVSKL